MLTVEIPGAATLRLEHAIFDFNGTLARDGVVAPATLGLLKNLAESLTLHVITANTHGGVETALAGLDVRLVLLDNTRPGWPQKAALVRDLGPENSVALGNGRNDAAMLAEAALGIAILGEEGAAREALLAARLVCRSIDEALECLLKPARLAATLRP